MHALDSERPSSMTAARLTSADFREIPAAGSARIERAATSAAAERVAAWGIGAMLIAFAYEWFLSGMNKLTSGDFRSGLSGQVADAVSGNPNHWYASLLNSVVVPHGAFFAVLTELGEIAVSLGLICGAVRWLADGRLSAAWRRRLDLATIGALAGSAFMTANYYLMSGFGIPWLHASDAFSEGLDIDGLLTIVALALLAMQVYVVRASRDDASAA